MAQDNDRRSPIKGHIDLIWPTHRQPVGSWEPLNGAESGAGVRNGNSKPQMMSKGTKGLSNMNRPEDDEGLRGHYRLYVGGVGAVTEAAVLAAAHQFGGVGRYVGGGLGQCPSKKSRLGVEDRSHTQIRTVDHDDARPQALVCQQPVEGLQFVGHHGSM
jgi:hypothetical protein